MSHRDPKPADSRRIDSATVHEDEVKGAKAAARGAGDPEVPSVGNGAESHHIAHAGSKQGQREDEDNVEDSGNEGKHKRRDGTGAKESRRGRVWSAA
jgi:hypothetical protein